MCDESVEGCPEIDFVNIKLKVTKRMFTLLNGL